MSNTSLIISTANNNFAELTIHHICLMNFDKHTLLLATFPFIRQNGTPITLTIYIKYIPYCIRAINQDIECPVKKVDSCFMFHVLTETI